MPAEQRSFSLRVLKRLLLLSMAAILLSAGLMIWHNWRMEHKVLQAQETAWTNEFSLDLERLMDSESRGLTQTLRTISAQPALIQALARKDTARLQEDWRGLFGQLRAEHNITHFYFIDRDRTCLQRLHLPEQRGDRIDRHTVLEAERTGQSAWGVEMGKTGVLTLRVVQPVFASDHLVGYLELGKEIELLLTQLRPSDEHDYRFAVLLHKAHIDRASWETGMRMLGRQADWEALPRHVVEFLGPEFSMAALQTLLSWPDWENAQIARELEGRRWHLRLLPLRVTGGDAIGSLLILHDITVAETAIAHRAQMLVLVTLAVAGGVTILFLWLVRRFFRQLREREAALYAENTKNLALLRNASDGIHVLDDQGRLFEASDAFCATLGYSREELIGQDVALWEATMSRDQIAAKLKQQLEAAARVQFETQHRRKDGSIIDVEVSGCAVTMGNRRYIFNSSRDITARKQTESALRESEQRFRQLFDDSPDPVWIIDNHRFVECNQAAVEILGYPDKQSLQNTHPAVLSPEYQPDGENSFDKAERMINLAQQRGLHRFEWVHTRRDGQEFFAEVTLSTLTLQGRQVIHCLWRDITDRQHIEHALRESEQRFRQIFELSPDAVWVMDDHRFEECNLAAVKLFALESREDFLRMHPADFSPEWQADGESSFAKAERMMNTVDSLGIHRFEWLHQRADGRVFDAEVTLSSIILQGKKRIYAQVRDITDRKLAENGLRQSEEKLRIILDSVDAFIYLKDTAGNYLFANAAVRQLWQVEMEDIIGYGDDKFFDAETAANIRHNDRQVLEQGITLRGEETNTVTKSGLTFTYLTVKLPLRGPDGRIHALCGISTDISDRKRMEEGLRKNERDLREAQRIAKVGSWELDILNNRLTWSDEIYRIFEIDPACFSASYDAFLAAVHSEDREAVDRAYTESLVTRQPYSIRHRLRMADGRIKHVHEQCRTDFDAGGKPLRSIGTVQDVTEQVQAEIAQHDAHDLLKTVIDHAPMRVFWKDRELRYLGCNPAFARDAGHSHPSELVGRDDYQMGWAHEADLYRADDLAVIETGIARINFEEPQTTPDGRPLWLRTSKVPLRNRNDEIIGVLGIYEDITAEKAKDDELIRHRNHLEELVQQRTADLQSAHSKLLDTQFAMEKAGIGIRWVDANTGRLLYSNRYAAEMLGYSVEEMLEMRVQDYDPNFQTSELERYISQLREEGHGEVETLNRAKDGRLIAVAISLYYVPEVEGTPARLIGFITDITQRKRNQTELLEAKLAAEAASQAKSAFLANMSHEIRTPMNGVIGMLEILSHSPLQKEESKMVESIRRSARSLLGIINDILDFSKIEAGKLSLAEQEVSLEAELDIVIGMIDRIAMDKQVDLTMFFEPRLPTHVLGDGLRLRQILTNLAGNAVKFSADMERIGRVQLRAELDGCENGLATVLFTIADNGIGMDAETVTRLFQPFEQADDSTTRKYGGTGLGLAISRNLTAMMGGKIAVQSDIGRGTTFTVRLPFKMASECPNTTSQYDLSELDCILVTSESRYLDDYTRYLEHAGARTHAFANLEAAWVYIAGHPPPSPVCMIVMEDPGIHSSREIVDRLLAKQPGDHVHFVEVTYLSVERGRRRRVRRLADRVVQIDREALTRSCFLMAVATATGRAVISPEPEIDARIVASAGSVRHILVAEDNEVNRDVIRRQLTMLGYRAELAADGQEAFRCWETGHYDLLLTDLHMPNTDGYELTRLIRAAEARHNLYRLPIIALTANAMKGEEERCLSQGMDAYLAKPIELAQLKFVLGLWLPSSDLSTQLVAEEASASMPVAEAPELPVFDPDVLTKIVGNKPAIHRRLLEKFLGGTREQLSALLQANAARDAEIVRQKAHSLKSAARSVGAMRLSDLFAQLEHAGRSGDGEQCRILVKQLEAVFDEAARMIRLHMENS